jgi:hypothetical protein
MMTPDTQRVEPATPAEQARAYAKQHGYRIVSSCRKLDIWTNFEGDEKQNHVAQVSGYPAALNAMKRHAEAQNIAACTAPADRVPDECAASGASCSYMPHGRNGEWQCQYCGKPSPTIPADTVGVTAKVVLAPADHAAMLNDPTRTVGVSPQQWADHVSSIAHGETFDQQQVRIGVDFAASPTDDRTALTFFKDGELVHHASDAEIAEYTRRSVSQLMAPAVFEGILSPADSKAASEYFDSVDAAARQRIRRYAKRIARAKRRAEGRQSPGGPWHVIFDGSVVMKYGYPTRSAALAIVRWGFNHPVASIRNNWRTNHVFIEYRPS